MNILKGQKTEYLKEMIEACHELWAWYREDNDNDYCKYHCPLCNANEKLDQGMPCFDCPWIWFTGDACSIGGFQQWKKEKRHFEFCRQRNRQLPRWIAYMEAELEDRKA